MVKTSNTNKSPEMALSSSVPCSPAWKLCISCPEVPSFLQAQEDPGSLEGCSVSAPGSSPQRMSLIPPDSPSDCQAPKETGCLESLAPFPRSIFSLPRFAAILLARAQTSLLQSLPTTSLIGRLREALWGHPAHPPLSFLTRCFAKIGSGSPGRPEDLLWQARRKQAGGLKCSSERTRLGLNATGNNDNAASPPILDTFHAQRCRAFRNTSQDKRNPAILLVVLS